VTTEWSNQFTQLFVVFAYSAALVESVCGIAQAC